MVVNAWSLGPRQNSWKSPTDQSRMVWLTGRPKDIWSCAINACIGIPCWPDVAHTVLALDDPALHAGRLGSLIVLDCIIDGDVSQVKPLMDWVTHDLVLVPSPGSMPVGSVADFLVDPPSTSVPRLPLRLCLTGTVPSDSDQDLFGVNPLPTRKETKSRCDEFVVHVPFSNSQISHIRAKSAVREESSEERERERERGFDYQAKACFRSDQRTPCPPEWMPTVPHPDQMWLFLQTKQPSSLFLPPVSVHTNAAVGSTQPWDRLSMTTQCAERLTLCMQWAVWE